jgi:hypothetical protein
MKDKIIFINGKRISNYLGVQIKDHTCPENYPENEIIANFIKEYNNYLLSNKIEDLKEFYELTGLLITHIYDKNDGYKIIYSMNKINRTKSDSDAYRKPVYTTHILVISNYDDPNDNKYYSKIFWQNQKEYEILNEVNYDLCYKCKNIKDKINTIESKFNKNTFKGYNKNNIKEVEITSLNNVIILLKDGSLYFDNKLYASNVKTIWHQDSYNSFIIYNDNKLEELICEFPHSRIKNYTKIVYNDYIFATLKRKKLSMIFKTYEDDVTIMHSIFNVNDIDIDNEFLYILTKEETLKIPTFHDLIVVQNKDIL